MSLVAVVKGPEGIVLAADSRITYESKNPQPSTATGQARDLVVHSFFDSATKILWVDSQPFIAAVTWGNSSLAPRVLETPASCLKASEHTFAGNRLSVEQFSLKIVDCFRNSWRHDSGVEPVHALVAGFDPDHSARLFLLSFPTRADPKELLIDGAMGAVFGGQTKFVDVLEMTKLPFEMLGLQDCVDIAVVAIQLTTHMNKWLRFVCNVGGPVDVATITSSGGRSVQQAKTVEARSMLDGRLAPGI